VSTYFKRDQGKLLKAANRKTSKTDPAATNGGRMAGGERRLQILRVAMRLFSQRGFRGTTTKEIAQAAAVSEAMVFRHFATKEELYSAILDHKACLHDALDPRLIVADAIKRKDDAAVFEGLALDALDHHDCDPEFQRLLLHSALEEHDLAHMFWDKFVRRIYRSLGGYIRERQREGAIVEIEPALVVRAFIGMVMHHSLNNNLWDRKQSLLRVSNQTAAREFTSILLQGVASRAEDRPRAALRKSKRAVAGEVGLLTATSSARQAGKRKKPTGKKSKRKRSSR
jgi:AcrR family transcriptional regulator